MNARTTAIARRQRERLQAERRARLVDACRGKARTVRRREPGDTGLSDEQYEAACDAALGGPT